MDDGGTELIAILRRQWRYLLKIGLMKHGLYMEKPTQDIILSLMIVVNTFIDIRVYIIHGTLHIIVVNGRMQ